MLFADWTTGDQNNFRRSKGKTVPDFHLPTKVVIAVPYKNDLWDVFWSTYGGDHAEDVLSRDSNYRNIHFFNINYTPCAKRCTPTLRRNFRSGGCPKIYAVWPYKISPKGVQRNQVQAIRDLIATGCEIDTWRNFSPYVNAICSLRSRNDLLCSDIKKAINSKAFRYRNYYAYSLIDTIKSSGTLDDKVETLEDKIEAYNEVSYPTHDID